MKCNYFTLFSISCLLLFSTTNLAATKKIKVACVGNSITFGAFIVDRETNCYPAQLQTLLGDDYEVMNFGVSGSTLLNNGNYPYTSTGVYTNSKNFNPDIVFIKLGTNDSKPQNRVHLDASYKNDYLKLINSYRNLPSHPRIILLTPLRCFSPDNSTEIDNGVIQKSITPRIKEIAFEQNLEIIDMYYLFGDVWNSTLLPDKLHPSATGASFMARKLYCYLATERNDDSDVLKKFSLQATDTINFHGFKGCKYNNNGTEYCIVTPHKAAQGNPWIWRASLWGEEPQTDLSMLEQGFYLTFCNVNDAYGSPKAVEQWNTFYQLAIEAGLNAKPVLEGMDQGALIAYNWTAQNSEKVSGIYADAPVMDIKSWPMGKGVSAGSPDDTEKMMAAYDFKSEEEALAWKGNPIDHSSVLAKAEIPMLHIVGDADEIVPVNENTSVFENKLLEEGYKLKVIHKPGVKHRPYSLNNPESIIHFLLQATDRDITLPPLPPILDHTLAYMRPCSASSEKSETKCSYATDNDESTTWHPAANDTEKWFKLDLQEKNTLARIQLIFPTSAVYKYTIEVSQDDKAWTKVIDQSDNSSAIKSHTNVGNMGHDVRYIRITFKSSAAAISELRVSGAPNWVERPANLLSGTVIGTDGSWDNNPNTTKEAAFDFDTSSAFDAANGSGAWVGLDLGKDANFVPTQVIYHPRQAQTIRMSKGMFEISKDKSFTSPTNIFTITTAPADIPFKYITADFNTTEGTRYIRYKSPDGGFCNAAELEFYGYAKTIGIETEKVPLKQSYIRTDDNGNPILFMESFSDAQKKIELYSVDGCYLKTITTTSKQININKVLKNKGAYLIKLKIGQMSENHKIIF